VRPSSRSTESAGLDDQVNLAQVLTPGGAAIRRYQFKQFKR